MIALRYFDVSVFLEEVSGLLKTTSLAKLSQSLDFFNDTSVRQF